MQGMTVKERKTVIYWVKEFTSSLLDSDDLMQEAFLVYLNSRENYQEGRSSFYTFFSNCLHNHFTNLYNRRKQGIELVAITLDDPVDSNREDGETVGKSIASCKWTPLEQLEWEELLQKVEERLDTIALQIFVIRTRECPLELSEQVKGKHISDTRLASYLGVKRKVVTAANKRIKRAVLLACSRKPIEVHRILRSL